jgi:hypothetical protein
VLAGSRAMRDRLKSFNVCMGSSIGSQRTMDAISTPPPHSIFQPLFHVQHAVGGSEQTPLNLWSIVLLTKAPDPRYCEPFEQMVRTGLLPGFIEIYIERDLKLRLSRI